MAVTGVAVAGLPRKFDITHYEIHSDKVVTPVRAVMLADLHNDSYGPKMKKLVQAVRNQKPDLILMPGDMCDIDHQEEHTLEFFREMSDIPMYYSTGNHEEFRNDLPILLNMIKKTGVNIPEHTGMVFQKGDTRLEILSLPCYKQEYYFKAPDISAQFHTDGYRILLAHRPEWFNLYRDVKCDLITSGHAHGGQWRIPGTDQGVFAPEQGMFPKLTSGMHELGHNKMIINRGLVRFYHMAPRLYNNPEITVIDFLPEEGRNIC
jgi:predicted MPP superfamily phosphohydrolase